MYWPCCGNISWYDTTSSIAKEMVLELNSDWSLRVVTLRPMSMSVGKGSVRIRKF